MIRAILVFDLSFSCKNGSSPEDSSICKAQGAPCSIPSGGHVIVKGLGREDEPQGLWKLTKDIALHTFAISFDDYSHNHKEEAHCNTACLQLINHCGSLAFQYATSVAYQYCQS